MGIMIAAARTATDELVIALNSLLPQLTSQAAPLSVEDLARIIAQAGLTLLIARDDARSGQPVVGTATVILVEELTGRHARLESVVVDASARGQGLGTLLTAEAIRLATEQRAVTLNLTSAPRREVANRLYQRLGFQRRETNVYHLILAP
jgi:ribosomal protein S18 acetylase RimI-like enzyme